MDLHIILEKQSNFIDLTNDSFVPSHFFGRNLEMDIIQKWIEDKKLFRTIVIYGLPGIGKTSIISKIIKNYKNSKHIFWHKIDKWDSSKSIIKEILDFFLAIDEKYLKFSLDFKTHIDINEIIEFLSEKMKNLDAIFIFDDYHKSEEDMVNFISVFSRIIERAENNKLIMITRYNIPFYEQKEVLVNKSVAELELEGLDFESGKQLLQNKGISPEFFKEFYNKTTGNPLLLELIESKDKFDRYINREIFSKLSAKEKELLEIFSIYERPVLFNALQINEDIEPEVLDNLEKRLFIKQTSDGTYYIHETIKNYFYQRLANQKKYQYHELCAKYYTEQDNPEEKIEAFYHYLKAKKYENAIDLVLKNSEQFINQGFAGKILIMISKINFEDIPISYSSSFLMLKGKLNFITGQWNDSLKAYYSALESILLEDNELFRGQIHFEIGHIYEELNQFDKALEMFRKGLEIGNKINDHKLIAEANRGMGRYYWRTGDYKSARKYYLKALNSLKESNEHKLIGSIYIDLGNIHYETEDNKLAIKDLLKAIENLEKTDDELEIARAYNSIGSVYLIINDYENAILFYKKLLNIAERTKDFKLITYGLSNMAYCHAWNREIEQAEDLLEQLKEMLNIIQNENVLYTLHKAEGLIFQYYKEYEKAIQCFEKSLEIVNKLNSCFHITLTLYELGLIYEENGKIKKATQIYREAYSKCRNPRSKLKKVIKLKLKEITKSD